VTLDILKDCVLKIPWYRWLPRKKSRQGRPPYPREQLLWGLFLQIREHLSNEEELVRKLTENSAYRRFCSFSKRRIPSHDTFKRFYDSLSVKRLESMFRHLDDKLDQLGVFRPDELALDATDLLTNGRNQHHPDLEAGYGHKSDKERFHGYWAYFVVGTKSELPRLIDVAPANIHQSIIGQDLLAKIDTIDKHGATIMLFDAAYDDKKTYTKVIELEMIPCVSYNPRKSNIRSFSQLSTKNWRKRSLGAEGIKIRRSTRKLRLSVERYQATFKHLLQGRVLPKQGLTNAKKYVYLTAILSQLNALVNYHQKVKHLVLKPQSLLNYFAVNTTSSHGGVVGAST